MKELEVIREVCKENRRSNENWREKITLNFRENEKQIWQGINFVWRVWQQVSEVVPGIN